MSFFYYYVGMHLIAISQYFRVFGQESGEGNGEVKKLCPDDVKAAPLSKVSRQQRDEILQLYKLHMPEDLYHFWDLCKELCPDNPCGEPIVICSCVCIIFTV